MATRPGSATNSGSSAVPLIQKRAERPPRARSMNEQMVMHLKALREIAMADQITQESKQKELVFLNATMDRIEVQMKASNADNNLRIQGLHEEQKRLGDIIEDDMERRKEWEKELLIFMKDAVTKVSTELGSGGTGGPESSHLGSQRTVHQVSACTFIVQSLLSFSCFYRNGYLTSLCSFVFYVSWT